MKTTAKLLLGCFGLLVGLTCVAAVAAAILVRRLPSAAQQLPLNTSPVTANIAQPLNGASLPSNEYTSVQASALGGVPLAALQLWVDGVPVAAQAAAGADARQVSGLFTWLPAGPGDHVLLVRALDQQGRTTNSNLVRVRVAVPEPVTEKGSVLAKDGDTVATVAKQAGTSPEIVLALNPGLDPNAILSAGQPITVPVVVPPDPGPDADPTAAPDATDEASTEPADTDTGAQALPPVVTPTPPPDGADGAGIDPLSPAPDPLPLWMLLNFANFLPPELLPAAQPLTAPEMAASLNGCQAQIFIFDHAAAEMGYFIYRLAPNATAFERVGVIGAIQGTEPVAYTEPALYGLSLYYVAAFDAKGEAASNVAPVDVQAPACAQPEQAALALKDAQLTVSQPVERLYCYRSFGGGGWGRLPADPELFLLPDAQGGFDLSAYLQVLASPPPAKATTLDLECWGWQGATLLSLGSAQHVFEPAVAGTSNDFLDISMDAAQFGVVAQPEINIGPVYAPLPSSVEVNPPTIVEQTNNATGCVNHFENAFAKAFVGTLLCPQAIDKKNVVLVWSWDPVDCKFVPDDCPYVRQVDGYRIYSGGDLLDTIADPSQKVGFEPPLKKNLNHNTIMPQCYTVTAYVGSSESEPSDNVCVGSQDVGAPSETLTPSQAEYTWIYQDIIQPDPDGCFYTAIFNPASILQPGFVAMGYNHKYDPVCEITLENEANAHVVFDDVKSFDPMTIWRATLSYNRAGGHYAVNTTIPAVTDWFSELISGDPFQESPNGVTLPDYSCASGLYLGKAWNGTHFKQATFLQDLPSAGDFPNIDVTTAVKSWLQKPGLHFGFILSGAKPAGFIPDTSYQRYCYGYYTSFTLKIEYFQ